MPGTTSFPTSLDNNTNLDETLQDNVDEVVVAHIINAYAAIKALQSKVGITSSAVNTTFDYLRNAVLRQSGLNVDLAGTLDVTGAVIFDSTLNVVGAADFDSNVNIDGNIVVDGTASIGGVMTVNAANFATPVTNSGSAAEGVATTFSRSDHNHGATGNAISAVGAYMQGIRSGAIGNFNAVPDGAVNGSSASGSLTGHEDWLFTSNATTSALTMLASGSNADVTIHGNKPSLRFNIPGNTTGEYIGIYQDDRPINPSLGAWISVCQIHLVNDVSTITTERPQFSFGLLAAATLGTGQTIPTSATNSVAISIGGGDDSNLQLRNETILNVRSSSSDIVDDNTSLTHIGDGGRWATWIMYYDGANLHVYEAIETARNTLTEVYSGAVAMPNTTLTFGAQLRWIGGNINAEALTVDVHLLNFSYLEDVGTGLDQWPNELP